jgi:hypothetical protein
LAGPGTIEPSVLFTFNKVGPVFFNYGGFFLGGQAQIPDEFSHFLIFIWGSFDGTTNPPIAYPQGISITNLENQVLMPISTILTVTNTVTGALTTQETFAFELPEAFLGRPYPPPQPPPATQYPVRVSFSGTGGQPPYTFGLSPGAPPGMRLSTTNNVLPGMLVDLIWTPTEGVGVFDISVRMTDAGGRYVERPFSIRVNP